MPRLTEDQTLGAPPNTPLESGGHCGGWSLGKGPFRDCVTHATTNPIRTRLSSDCSIQIVGLRLTGLAGFLIRVVVLGNPQTVLDGQTTGAPGL